MRTLGWIAHGENPMTEKEPQKIPLPRLQAYLSEVIFWLDEPDTVFLRSSRQLVKWFFDLVRNAFIAGGLRYLATKTDSWLLKIASETAFFALFMYCLSYVQTWHLRFLHPWWPANWAKIGDLFITTAILSPFIYMIVKTVPTAIEEIAKAQVR
jgi:hypothetical protein